MRTTVAPETVDWENRFSNLVKPLPRLPPRLLRSSTAGRSNTAHRKPARVKTAAPVTWRHRKRSLVTSRVEAHSTVTGPAPGLILSRAATRSIGLTAAGFSSATSAAGATAVFLPPCFEGFPMGVIAKPAKAFAGALPSDFPAGSLADPVSDAPPADFLAGLAAAPAGRPRRFTGRPALAAVAGSWGFKMSTTTRVPTRK